MSRLLLFDTASLYFRAFYGVPDTIRAPDGTVVNAARGLLDYLARFIGEYQPTHLACCWDEDWRPQWRVDLVPTYKAHRVEAEVLGGSDVEEVPDPLQVQIPIIISLLDALGFAVVGAPEHEADDVMGTLATNAGMPVGVISGDRDMFQLVDDAAGVRVIYPNKGQWEQVTDAVVQAKYGIRADQYADFATLRGDSSDGLPGVKGVGEKTAQGLLASFGDLAGIRAAAADPSATMAAGVRAKILASSDYLDVAPQVVAVVRDLDLGEVDLALPGSDEAHPAPRDGQLLEALAERWGLESSVERVLGALNS